MRSGQYSISLEKPCIGLEIDALDTRLKPAAGRGSPQSDDYRHPSNVGLVVTNRVHRLVWRGFTIHPHQPHLNVIHHGHGYYWIAIVF